MSTQTKDRRPASREEYEAIMLNATARIYDVLTLMRSASSPVRVFVDNYNGSIYVHGSALLQDALRTIFETVPPEEDEAT